jgi:hypothetical protein
MADKKIIIFSFKIVSKVKYRITILPLDDFLNIWQSQNADKLETCNLLYKNVYNRSNKIQLD